MMRYTLQPSQWPDLRYLGRWTLNEANVGVLGIAGDEIERAPRILPIQVGGHFLLIKVPRLELAQLLKWHDRKLQSSGYGLDRPIGNQVGEF